LEKEKEKKMISEKAQEVLESIWSIRDEKGEKVTLESLNKKEGDAPIKELLKKKMIEIIEEKVIKLTPEGERGARDAVRRHRLAERLLADVLDVGEHLIHETACQFEHHLHRGIDDNICTLLGHPKLCPHGKQIPSGKCCESKEPRLIKIVSPLSSLAPGQEGRIAYIQASDQKKLQKMMAMGVLPGQSISLLQSFPSYLFKVGNSQFAVDETIADEIFVRIEDVT